MSAHYQRRSGVTRLSAGRSRPRRRSSGFTAGLNELGKCGKVKHPRGNEDVEEALIEFLVTGHELKNVECRLKGERRLVGPIACDEGVENITDGHDLRLNRNLGILNPPRVPGPVEILMMGVRDVWNVEELRRPRDFSQEVISMCHVRLDFASFVGGQRPSADREAEGFVGQ